jgi:hypothetical protein
MAITSKRVRFKKQLAALEAQARATEVEVAAFCNLASDGLIPGVRKASW